MSFLQELQKDPKKYLKLAGIIFLGIIVLVFIGEFLSSSVVLQNNKLTTSLRAPQLGYSEPDLYAEDSRLSVRNIADSTTFPGQPIPPAGEDAEAFEFTSYSLSYEKSDATETCKKILDLKGRDDVIFSTSNQYDEGCYYIFKVKNESQTEIQSFLEQLDPENTSETTQTIKQVIEDYTSEEEILLASKDRIEQTLRNALTSYDEISALATQTQDTASLAVIIDSKINLIERLTQEKIRINEQLERLIRAKAEQLDRLDFTTYTITVYERKFVDGERIKDSWKSAIEEAVRSANEIVQALSVNLLVLLLLLSQYLIYALIMVIVAKYGWRIMKKIWKR